MKETLLLAAIRKPAAVPVASTGTRPAKPTGAVVERETKSRKPSGVKTMDLRSLAMRLGSPVVRSEPGQARATRFIAGPPSTQRVVHAGD